MSDAIMKQSHLFIKTCLKILAEFINRSTIFSHFPDDYQVEEKKILKDNWSKRNDLSHRACSTPTVQQLLELELLQ